MLLERWLLAAGLGFAAGSQLSTSSKASISKKDCDQQVDALFDLMDRRFGDNITTISDLASSIDFLYSVYAIDVPDSLRGLYGDMTVLINDTTPIHYTNVYRDNGKSRTWYLNDTTSKSVLHARVDGVCGAETGQGSVQTLFSYYNGTSKTAYIAKGVAEAHDSGSTDDANDDSECPTCGEDADGDVEGDYLDVMQGIFGFFDRGALISGTIVRDDKYNKYNLSMLSTERDEVVDAYFAEVDVSSTECPPKSLKTKLRNVDADEPLPSDVFDDSQGPLAMLFPGLEFWNSLDNKTNSNLTYNVDQQSDNTFPASTLAFEAKTKNGKSLPEDFLAKELDACELGLWDPEAEKAARHHNRKKWMHALAIAGVVLGSILVLLLLAMLLRRCTRSNPNRDPEKQSFGRASTSTTPSGTLAGSGGDDLSSRSTFNRGRPAGTATGTGNGTGAGSGTGATGNGAAAAGAGGQQERVVAAPGTERVVVQPAPASGTVAAP